MDLKITVKNTTLFINTLNKIVIRSVVIFIYLCKYFDL